MRMENVNWFDVQNYLKQDDRLILILGSCEQHGYLSLLADTKIPTALADAASQQSGVMIAPPVNFGASPYFLSYPGTFSLRLATLLDLVEDLVRSAHDHGFKRLLFLNGHGGNDPVRGRLYELANLLPALQIRWYAWWQSHSVEAVAIKHNLKIYHGGWAEAFPFTRVGEVPDGDKIPPAVPGLLSSQQARQVYGDGVFGGAYSAAENIMNELFNASLQDVLHMLRFE
jgi:creatinine amidohydrolase